MGTWHGEEGASFQFFVIHLDVRDSTLEGTRPVDQAGVSVDEPAFEESEGEEGREGGREGREG